MSRTYAVNRPPTRREFCGVCKSRPAEWASGGMFSAHYLYCQECKEAETDHRIAWSKMPRREE